MARAKKTGAVGPPATRAASAGVKKTQSKRKPSPAAAAATKRVTRSQSRQASEEAGSRQSSPAAASGSALAAVEEAPERVLETVEEETAGAEAAGGQDARVAELVATVEEQRQEIARLNKHPNPPLLFAADIISQRQILMLPCNGGSEAAFEDFIIFIVEITLADLLQKIELDYATSVFKQDDLRTELRNMTAAWEKAAKEVGESREKIKEMDKTIRKLDPSIEEEEQRQMLKEVERLRAKLDGGKKYETKWGVKNWRGSESPEMGWVRVEVPPEPATSLAAANGIIPGPPPASSPTSPIQSEQPQRPGLWSSYISRVSKLMPSLRRAPQTAPAKRTAASTKVQRSPRLPLQISPRGARADSSRSAACAQYSPRGPLSPTSPTAQRSSGQAVQLSVEEDVDMTEVPTASKNAETKGTPDVTHQSERSPHLLPEAAMAPPTPSSSTPTPYRPPRRYITRTRRLMREQKRQEEERQKQQAQGQSLNARAHQAADSAREESRQHQEAAQEESDRTQREQSAGSKRKRELVMPPGTYMVYYEHPDYESSSDEDMADETESGAQITESESIEREAKRPKIIDTPPSSNLNASSNTPQAHAISRPETASFSTPQPQHHRSASVFRAQTEPRHATSFTDNDYEPNPLSLSERINHMTNQPGHYDSTGQWITHGYLDKDEEETVETFDVYSYGLNRMRFKSGFTNGYSYDDPYIRRVVLQGRKDGIYVKDGEHPLSPDDESHGYLAYVDEEQYVQQQAEEAKRRDNDHAANKAHVQATELAKEVAATNAEYAAASSQTAPATSTSFGTPTPAPRTTTAVENTPSRLFATSGAPASGQVATPGSTSSLFTPSKSNSNTNAVEDTPSRASAGGAPASYDAVENTPAQAYAASGTPAFESADPSTPATNPNDPNSAIGRARDQAEKYKPKTPSRLREASRMNSSPAIAAQSQPTPVRHVHFTPPEAPPTQQQTTSHSETHHEEDPGPSVQQIEAFFEEVDPEPEVVANFNWQDPSNTERAPRDRRETWDEMLAREQRNRERSQAAIETGNYELGFAALLGNGRPLPELSEHIVVPPIGSMPWEKDEDHFARHVQDKSLFTEEYRRYLEENPALEL
ncbi:MAG: hypothetical protein Q9159_000383 [Coniocarpon cinnabarinum]